MNYVHESITTVINRAALVDARSTGNAILVLRMPADTCDKLNRCLAAMARGEDVWDDFIELVGRYILHVLINDYALYDEYHEHERQEILHDIYLKVKRNAFRFSASVSRPEYLSYLRKTIRSVMTDRGRIQQRLKRQMQVEPLDEATATPADHSLVDPLGIIEQHWRERATLKAVDRAIVQISQGAQNTRTVAIVLRCRLLKGQDYKQITSAAGISVDAARQIVRYYKNRVIQQSRQSLGLIPAEGGIDEKAR